MTYNFHTHTYLCGHANGNIEDYIETAIKGGIKHMGFSEHIPYICSDGYESDFRLQMSDIQTYFSEIRWLREKYRADIDIKIGFEIELYPLFFEETVKNAVEYGAEYLIQGQHFLDEEHPDGVHIITETKDTVVLKKYADNVIMGIKSGVITYIAHPDMINFVGEDKVFDEQVRRICVSSREHNIPLEINCMGIRCNRNYPDPRFWKIAGEEKAPVVIGFDSHNFEDAFDKDSLKKAKGIIENCNLNYTGMPKLILLQERKNQNENNDKQYLG